MTAMTKLSNFKSLDASIVYAKATKISFAEQGKKSSLKTQFTKLAFRKENS